MNVRVEGATASLAAPIASLIMEAIRDHASVARIWQVKIIR